MPETERLNPIACESCRQRKCKCDRKLPHCSQCSNESSKCSYPESGKRGLPLGYINQLEHRLAETESALYAALATLRSLGPALVVEAKAKQDSALKQKAARMEEWNQLPLRGWADMEHWQRVMSDQFSVEQSQEVPFAGSSGAGYSLPIGPPNYRKAAQGDENVQAPFGISPWHSRRETQVQALYKNRLQPPEMTVSPVHSRGHISAGSESVTSPVEGLSDYTNATEAPSREPAQSTMADELSRSKPSIYF